MLDDSYLQQQEAPLDPTMQKSKYRDTFDRVMEPASSSSVTSPHGPRSSTPRRAEQVDMSFNVSSVPHGSPYSTRTDESSSSRSHDNKEQSRSSDAVNHEIQFPAESGSASGDGNAHASHANSTNLSSNRQDIVKGSTAAAGWDSSLNRSTGEKSKSIGSEPADEPPKRNRNSAIMARAAFWDKRVDEGIASDKEVGSEFPDLPVATFKR